MFLRYFIFVSFFFGLLLVFLTPPCQTPDEKNHFYRAIHITNGHFLAEKRTDRLGGLIPIAVDSFATTFMRLQNENTLTTSFGEIYSFTHQQSFLEKEKFTDFNNTGFFAPIGYLHSAIAIYLLKKTHLAPIFWLWGARFFALCVWIFLIYQCLKLLKESRILFLCLAILPASLAVNVSLSPDMLCNGLSFWCIAAILHHLENNNSHFNFTFRVWFGIAICVITWMKIVYMPLVLMLLLIPSFYKNNKTYFMSLIVINLSIILIWAKITSGLFIPYEQYAPQYQHLITTNEGVCPTEQLLFVVSHPVEFIKTLFYTCIDYMPSTMVHYVAKFGWEKNYLPVPFIILLWIIILLQVMKNYNFKLKQRLLLAFIGGLIVVVFSIVMYMLWTPVGINRIWSFGGRYFIPVFPIFFLTIIGLKKISTKYHFLIDRGSLIALVMCNMSLVWAIINRYYIIFLP